MADEHTDTPPVAGETTNAAAPERLGQRALATAVYAASHDVPTTWIDRSDGGLDDVEALLAQQADIEREDLAAAIGLPIADGVTDRDLQIASRLTRLLAQEVELTRLRTRDAERDAETTALRASELDANATLGRTVRLLATALGLDPQTVRLDDLIERAENLRARDAAWKAYADDLSALLDRRNWYAPPLPAVLADPAAQENQA